MDLADRIAGWRSARGLSQRALAKKVGVSAAAVAMWETGDTSPTQDHLESVVAAFGTTLQKFFGRVPKKLRAA